MPRHSRRYFVRVIQHPIHARSCGFGSNNRRPLDPPPIVQLFAQTSGGEEAEIRDSYTPFFVLHASLWSADGQEQRSIAKKDTRRGEVVQLNALQGVTVATPEHYRDTTGHYGYFLTFGDISVRDQGEYRLKFVLYNLRRSNFELRQHARQECEIMSDPFSVITPRQFPGMLPSTPLTHCFVQQAAQLPSRSKPRRRSASGSSSGDGESSRSQTGETFRSSTSTNPSLDEPQVRKRRSSSTLGPNKKDRKGKEKATDVDTY
ncbi:hypothetical protein BZG36_05012 [Bifiguratus adelaidae]|uniref:Velvet domain-containing protein n=1 Tax=Bifiguratus adelaidae TaxID=1938954 RepID=A0A261XU52_9FUNG|nr:hypothetical protein BZG36_05012 [Bifiguratus adelaidae]